MMGKTPDTGPQQPAADPNDPFGFLVASKPVQNGS